VSNDTGSVLLETILSIAALGGFIWGVGFLVPRAVKEKDRLALTCAVLTAVVALLAWLLIGLRVR